jgi:hypothetical protein
VVRHHETRRFRLGEQRTLASGKGRNGSPSTNGGTGDSRRASRTRNIQEVTVDITPQTADHQGNIAQVAFIYESPNDGITANPGGGQAGATPLSTELSRVTTVATSGDSVK